MANFDIYEAITDRIIAELEAGIIPWEKPWTGTTGGAISRSTGRPYSLLNQMLLGRPGEYLTWTQIKREGGSVKKGAKASMVVFWKIYHREETDDDGQPMLDADGQPLLRGYPVLRYFNVYHLDDCEGIAPKYTQETVTHANPIRHAEETFDAYAARSGVRIENVRSDRAFYSPALDLIRLPLMEQFPEAGGYYATLAHEATHSTGHHTRLDRFQRDAASAAFRGEAYSKEELIAEIGSAVIMHRLGLQTDRGLRNSAAYIQSWLGALRNDKRLIVSAASRAEKAVDLIMGADD